MKECTKCHRVLPESSFYIRRDTGRLQSQCIDCCKAHGRLRNGTTGVYRKEENNLKNNVMDKKEVYARVEVVTPDIAREYLKFNTVNRPINKDQVDFYASQMSKGRWLLNGEAICFSKGGSLVNGQHRLNAIIKSGENIQLLVVRNCDENSFKTYDSGRQRTVSEVFSIEQIPNYAVISSIITKHFVLQKGGASVAMNSNGSNSHTTSASSYYKGRNKKSKEDYLEEYNNHSELYQQIYKFASQCVKKIKLLNITDVGALYSYLVIDKSHDARKVEMFFKMLFMIENTISNNTINIYREKIIKDKFNNNNTMSPKYKQQILAKTWNAYITGKEIKFLKWSEEIEGIIDFI